MRTKLNAVYQASVHADFDVIVLVETWLNLDFADAEIFDAGIYIVFRKDRDYSRYNCVKGGGVLIAVNKKFISSICVLSNADTLIDQLCVSLDGRNGNLLLIVSYIPPNSSDTLYDAHVQNIIDLASNNNNSRFLVLGDFNLSKVSWSLYPNSDLLCPINVNNSVEINVIDSLLSLNLAQINRFYNRLGKILDLIFIDQDLKFDISNCLNPFSKSDMHHIPLEISLEFYLYSRKSNDVNGLDFTKCNFDVINSLIAEINWLQVFEGCDLNTCYDKFISTVYRICVDNVPPCVPSIHKLPWYTRGLKILKNKRNKHDNLYKSTNSLHHKELFDRYSREFNFLNKFLYKQYVFNFEKNIKLNPKYFWYFINSKRNSSGFPSKMFFDDKVSSSTSEIVDMFADYFSSNFVQGISNGINSVHQNSSIDFGMVQLSADDILSGISKLKASFKVDSDGFCGKFLKNCDNALVIPLLILFNKSLSEGLFVDKWKIASITPIYKYGARDNIKNYRPISKLSNISKVFEHVVFDKVYFAVKSIISPNQHGFVKGRSTVTNLLVFSEYCISSFSLGCQVDTVYMDISKAFDKVSHNVLLKKLSVIGFHSMFLKWVESYLSNRISFVSLDSVNSYHYNATSGVPQGSILGPLFFILFMNDISSVILNSEVLLYADDLKIFLRINSISDVFRLQIDIHNIVHWCSVNQLQINLSKCFLVSYYKCRNPIFYKYSIDSQALETLDEIKDLGVVFDSKFTFVNHINMIVPKAYALLAFIKRNCRDFSDPYTIKLVYMSTILTKLEYGCLIWNPFYTTHISRLERIQKKFISFALRSLNFTLPIPSYVDRCRLIHLKSLENRRKLLSLKFVYKLVCGYIDCPALLGLINFNVPTRFLRHNYVFNLPIHRSNYSANEPINRALNEFNRISNLNIDIFGCLERFVSILDIIYF